jgi:hypothetical protein
MAASIRVFASRDSAEDDVRELRQGLGWSFSVEAMKQVFMTSSANVQEVSFAQLRPPRRQRAWLVSPVT